MTIIEFKNFPGLRSRPILAGLRIFLVQLFPNWTPCSPITNHAPSSPCYLQNKLSKKCLRYCSFQMYSATWCSLIRRLFETTNISSRKGKICHLTLDIPNAIETMPTLEYVSLQTTRNTYVYSIGINSFNLNRFRLKQLRFPNRTLFQPFSVETPGNSQYFRLVDFFNRFNLVSVRLKKMINQTNRKRFLPNRTRKNPTNPTNLKRLIPIEHDVP